MHPLNLIRFVPAEGSDVNGWPANLIPRLLSRPVRVVGVDRVARDRMAWLVRQLAARRITNDEFEMRADEPACAGRSDPAIHEALFFCWGWCDDFKTHTLRPLTRDERREFARLVLFLRSDEPYCWFDGRKRSSIPLWFVPVADMAVHALVGVWLPVFAVLRVAVFAWLRREPVLIPPRRPDHSARAAVWPFADQASLDRANQESRLLGSA